MRSCQKNLKIYDHPHALSPIIAHKISSRLLSNDELPEVKINEII